MEHRLKPTCFGFFSSLFFLYTGFWATSASSILSGCRRLRPWPAEAPSDEEAQDSLDEDHKDDEENQRDVPLIVKFIDRSVKLRQCKRSQFSSQRSVCLCLF